MATVRSEIISHLTANMTCPLKSLALADSEFLNCVQHMERRGTLQGYKHFSRGF